VTECSPSSTSVLHKQWAELENEHHELATAIDAARAKKGRRGPNAQAEGSGFVHHQTPELPLFAPKEAETR